MPFLCLNDSQVNSLYCKIKKYKHKTCPRKKWINGIKSIDGNILTSSDLSPQKPFLFKHFFFSCLRWARLDKDKTQASCLNRKSLPGFETPFFLVKVELWCICSVIGCFCFTLHVIILRHTAERGNQSIKPINLRSWRHSLRCLLDLIDY